MKHARKEKVQEGGVEFTEEELERYGRRYDVLIAAGCDQNSRTKGRKAKKEETTRLNRLEKYKEKHLLFLHDFQAHYSNNMSEKDL